MFASTLRTTRYLALAAGLLVAGTAGVAEAGGNVAEAGSYVRTTASASIIAPEAPPRLLPAAFGTSTAALDGEGRALSVSLPTRLMLRGDAHADPIAARAALAPGGIGTARLMLTPERPLRRIAAGYSGELRMSLDYN